MKKTIIAIVVALPCLNFWARAQEIKVENRASIGIQIGQQVPDVTITNIINYKTSIAKISDFRGKLLILDFWATWCSPCVALIPTMDRLQKAFNKQVVFLPVTYQSSKVVKPFLAKLHADISFDLPDVLEDTVLHAVFPHRNLPHLVWISPEGKLLAITNFDQLTDENIKKVLVGSSQQLIAKEEMKRVSYDPKEPLFIESNGGNGSSLKYHRLFSNFTEGLSLGYKFYKDSVAMKITARNQTLLNLYSLAYGEGQKFLNKNRVILEVKDPASFTSNKQGNEYLRWMREGNVYCYELIMPGVASGTAFNAMREDLSLFFTNYEVSVERRNVPCIVLETIDKNIVASKGGERLNLMSRNGASIRNGSWNHFVGRLDDYYLQLSPLPLLDATGITGFVDMEIKANMSDPKSINEALIPYGLSLKPANRMVEMLVIKEKIKKTF